MRTTHNQAKVVCPKIRKAVRRAYWYGSVMQGKTEFIMFDTMPAMAIILTKGGK